MIRGLQGEGDSFLDNNHVLATAKHFLGDGGTKNGIDQGNTIISEKDLREIHGEPYFAAIVRVFKLSWLALIHGMEKKHMAVIIF